MNFKIVIAVIGMLFAVEAQADPLEPLIKSFYETERKQIREVWDRAVTEADRQQLLTELRQLQADTKFRFRDLLPGGRVSLRDIDWKGVTGMMGCGAIPALIGAVQVYDLALATQLQLVVALGVRVFTPLVAFGAIGYVILNYRVQEERGLALKAAWLKKARARAGTVGTDGTADPAAPWQPPAPTISTARSSRKCDGGEPGYADLQVSASTGGVRADAP